MKTALGWLAAVGVMVSGCKAAGAQSESPPNPETVFPFVLPWDDASPGIADLSGWLAKPAGRFGQVRAGEDGHFYAGNQRLRFLGVNMSFGGGLPTREDAPKLAGRLAKFGINVVRFHHLDTGAFPNGIRSPDSRQTGELAPEAVERLAYFIAQLKERGIYANINLLVGRPFNAADGLPAEIEKLDWKDRHIVGFFNRTQLELQQQYARQLLTHTNPHTGLAYTQDPAVAFVEINNEQGLVQAWLGRNLDTLPEVFLTELRAQWNQWLKQRFQDTGRLREAWLGGEQPLGAPLLKNTAFAEGLAGWDTEQHEGAQLRASVVEPAQAALKQAPNARVARLQVVKPGKESWHVQFNQAGFKLEAGQPYTLAFWAKAEPGRSVSVSVSQAHESWQNLGLSARADLSAAWREFRFVFTASQGDDRARVSFSDLGGAGSSCWLAEASLRAGGVFGLKPQEDLGANSVPLFTRAAWGERTAEAQRDWLRFLVETEEAYWQAMYRFLKDELKVRALVTGTIAGCAPVNLMAKMDWVDTHSYWQHPRFPRRPWDAEDWLVENRTMVNEHGGTLSGLALRRVLGKPHACTEYNHPAPNTYCSEGFLLLAAYAALQDWDAIYAYSYAHSRNSGWDTRKINGFFDIDQHPTKMATLPAVAAMFVRGDVRPARQLAAVELPREKEVDLLRGARSWDLVNGRHLGLPSEAPLLHRVALAVQGSRLPGDVLPPGQVKVEGEKWPSDSGELAWELGAGRRGLVTVDTDRSMAVIGYGGGKRLNFRRVSVEPGMGREDGWCAITITVKEGEWPTSAAERKPVRVLITATGYAENTGMKWKDQTRSSVGRDWGEAPSRVEGISARLTWGAAPGRVQAWALDERGQRREKMPVEAAADGRGVVTLGPKWRTLWYEVVID